MLILIFAALINKYYLLHNKIALTDVDAPPIDVFWAIPSVMMDSQIIKDGTMSVFHPNLGLAWETIRCCR